MASDYETFWNANRYAVVGHHQRRPFPKLTYGGLKKNGKVVYPVDVDEPTIEGDKAYRSLAELPESVEAVVIEVPKEETLDWCKQAVARGIKEIWLHGNSETPEVLAYTAEQGVHLRYGTCAVMYLSHGFSPHTVHRFFRRLGGKY